MRHLIWLIPFSFFFKVSFSQNQAYKESIDSSINNVRKGNKVYHDRDSSGKIHYFYNRQRKEIVTIIYTPSHKHSAYEYHFVNGELVKLIPYIPYSQNPAAIGKPMRACYYFRNGIVEYKYEENFVEIDIDFYRKLGETLFQRSSVFITH